MNPAIKDSAAATSRKKFVASPTGGRPLAKITVELTPEELKAVARNRAQVLSGLETADVNASQRAHDKLQQAARDRLK